MTANRPSSPKPPRRISAGYLENAALHYLERFASSTENLRRVLMRKVLRAAQHWGDDPAEGAALVEALIDRYQRAQLLNDSQYAEARSRSLHRRGGSTRMIRAKLAAKGVEADIIDGALDDLREDVGDDPDLAAAVAFARRRRLGPFRPPEAREANRDRDMAALGRAGFSHEIARKLVRADSPEDLEE